MLKGHWNFGTKKTNDIRGRITSSHVISHLIPFHLIFISFNFSNKNCFWGRIINKLNKKNNVKDLCNIHRKEIPHAVSGETMVATRKGGKSEAKAETREPTVLAWFWWGDPIGILGWWFEIFRMFTPKIGKRTHPIWLAHIFSDGLVQSPTFMFTHMKVKSKDLTGIILQHLWLDGCICSDPID